MSSVNGKLISLGLGNDAGDSGGRGFGEPKASQVQMPADMIAIGDSGLWPLMIEPRHAAPGGVSVTLAYNENVGNVHFGGPNLLFCDGHVQRFTLAEVAYLAAYPDMNQIDHMTIMWNRNHLPLATAMKVVRKKWFRQFTAFSGHHRLPLRPINMKDFAISMGYDVPSYDEVGNIHLNGANILFCDGHVRWCAISEVAWPYSAVLTPEVDRISVFWNCAFSAWPSHLSQFKYAFFPSVLRCVGVFPWSQ
jgi:prepilin-type processing-associated H-X9-DG protein